MEGGPDMLGRQNGRVFECVVVDLNTQRDFCEPDGAQPVENVPELIPALRRVIAWARWNYAPTVSSMESHRSTELSDSGYPVCCLDGSSGQHKMSFTLFPKRRAVEIDNTLAIPTNVFRRYQQVIFRKRTDDLLANPKADRLLTQLRVKELIIFGTALETSVKALVLALLARDKCVTVVVDACGYWHKATADLALRQMEAKGARIITVDELLRRKLDRQLRAWYHPLSRNGRTSNGRSRSNSRLGPRKARRRHALDPQSDAPDGATPRPKRSRSADRTRPSDQEHTS